MSLALQTQNGLTLGPLVDAALRARVVVYREGCTKSQETQRYDHLEDYFSTLTDEGIQKLRILPDSYVCLEGMLELPEEDW